MGKGKGSDSPAEMYVDEIEVYDYDDFVELFGFYPDDSEEEEDESTTKPK